MPEKKQTFREQMKGFPVWQMAVICMVRFSEPIAFSSLFPFIYFMIRDFGIAKDKADIATYSGYLAASFAFFQFVFCVRWGTAADKYGRKPILMLGLLGTMISILMFGFAKNYWFALFARSMMGSSNGNIAVLRTVIGELNTERKHQAIAFSTLPLFWNIGFVIGPLIGGSKYLTRPRKLPEDDEDLLATTLTKGANSLYERFITKFPYALPNIVVSIFLASSMVVAFLFLEETHRKFKNRRDIGLELGDKVISAFGYEPTPRAWQKKKLIVSEITEQTPLIPESPIAETSVSEEAVEDSENNQVDGSSSEDVFEEVDDQTSIESFGPVSKQLGEAIIRRYSTIEDRPNLGLSRTTTQNSILTTIAYTGPVFTKPITQAMTANFLTSLTNIVYSEFLPVLLAGTFMVDELKFPFHMRGGFGFALSDIGTLLSSTGFIGSVSVLFLFPYLDRTFKTIHTYRLASLIFPITYFLLPYLVFTLPGYSPSNPAWLTKFLLYLLASINSVCNAITFPNITMLIHRASHPDHRSYINGSALSLSSLARFLGPVLWGYVMSITEKHGVAQASWFILAILAGFCSVQAFFMKEHDEDLKAVQPVEEPSSEVTV